MNKKTLKKGLTPYLLLIFVIVGTYLVFGLLNRQVHTFTYDQFIKELNADNITELQITPKDRAVIYQIDGKLEGYKSNESFTLSAPLTDSVISNIITVGEDSESSELGFKLNVNSDPESSSLLLIIVNILPLVFLGVLIFWFLSKQLNTGGKSMDFGRSKAELSSDENKVTFEEVAGLKEEKEEVKEIIDFLKEPKKFQKLGARIPKGILLVGPPGTGKTLLAKAVAGESKVPFYFISGSDFVELFVGVGASRVRDMFKQAKQNAPCLIFIDEIDAVGRQRGTGLGGGHDEREQTLNQLLTEMDGFGLNEGIIIMAATNRADVLDPALLRPGRFDRQVTVSLPDVREREEILGVHARNKILGKGVTLKNVAQRTPGFSGAALENLLNEAALLAVRREKDHITMDEIDEATDRVIAGPAKVSRKYTEHEKEVIAYHEAGHAVIGLKLEKADSVHKITIIPRGDAGGYTLMMPKEETYLSTKTELLDRIVGLLAGRVAEELRFNEVTTGAHNDFEKATKIARAMVTEYGMSDLGPVQLEQQEGGVFLGRDYNKSKNFSNEVAHEIDQEVRKIINKCYEKSREIISNNQDLLKLLVDALLEYETLTKEQIEYLVEHGKMPQEEGRDTEEKSSEKTVSELKEMAKKKKIKGYSKMNKKELEEAVLKDE